MTPKGISKEKGSYVGVHISVPTLDCALDSKKSIKWVSFSWLLSYLQLLTAACFGLSSLSIRGFNPSESTIGFLAHAAPAAAMGRPPSDTSVLSGLTCPVHRAGFFNAKKWPFNQKVTFNYSWRSEIWKSDSFLACESDIACHSEKKWIFNDKGRPNRTDTCHYHNNHGRNDHCGPYFLGGEGIPTCLARLFFIFNREFRGEKKIKLLLDMASSLWYQYSVVQPLVQPVPSRSFVRSPHGSDSSQGNVGKHHQESNKIQYPLGVTE